MLMSAGSIPHISLNEVMRQFAVSFMYSLVSMALMMIQPLSAGAFDFSRTIQRTGALPLVRRSG